MLYILTNLYIWKKVSMNRFYQYFLIWTLQFTCIYGATAQNTFQVKGKLKGLPENEDLIGATVQVKGTTIGTTTDIDGNYTLELEAGEHYLLYSYVGYQTLTERVTGKAGDQIIKNVSLSPDLEVLKDVIVVGYGEAKKANIAGSITSVSSEDFNKGVIISPEQMLQGKVSGLRISANNGEPGAAMNVSVRGLNSINSGNGPLFVVDGIPLSSENTGISFGGANGSGGNSTSPAKNPLNFLNPNDIQSIQVLKDASATAIYGSRASNGVIIIETKSGTEGEKTTIDYAAYASLSLVANKIEVLSGDEFREQQAKLGLTELGSDGGNVLSQNSIDWQDEIFRPAWTTNHNVSLSSGGKKSSLNASVGVFDQEGIIETSEYKRYTGRLKAINKYLDDRWEVGISILGSHTKDNRVPLTNTSGQIGDLLIWTLRANPTAPFTIRRDPSGGIVDYYSPAIGHNPLVALELFHDQTKIDRMMGSFTSSIKPIEGLDIRTQVSIDRSNARRSMRVDPLAGINPLFITDGGEGALRIANKETSNFLIDNYATFKSKIQDLEYKLMIGYSYQRFFNGSNTYSIKDQKQLAGEPGLDFSYRPNYYDGNLAGSGSNFTFELKSYISRLDLNWNDRYIFTGTIRQDGSEKFRPLNDTLPDNEFSFFPSLALKWKLTNEPFLQSIKRNVEIGLRGSWGQTGNQNIPLYSNVPVISRSQKISPGSDVEINQESYGNPSLKWETTTQLNIGVDFTIFQNRVYGNFDFFNKTTSDLLFRRGASAWDYPIPGSGNVWGNDDAEIVTEGFEFLVGGYPFSSDKFTWDLSLNLTSLETRIENLRADEPTGELGGPGASGSTVNILRNGEPISFYLIEFGGFNEDGSMILPNGTKQTPAGSVFPDFTYGINSTIYYKNWDFTMNWNAVVGQKLFNNTVATNFAHSWLPLGGNVVKDVVDNQPSQDNPELAGSTYYLEKADFLRLNNLSIGYRFPTENISWLADARVYFTGQNLLLFTNYSGYDPEVNANSPSANGYPSYGIDYSTYPKARVFTIGMNVTL